MTSHAEHIHLVKNDTSGNDAPYRSPEDVIKYFRGSVLFSATERLTAHLEKKRRNRIYQVFLYALPDGNYDISRQNSDHSLKEPFAVAEYSCGCWTIIG